MKKGYDQLKIALCGSSSTGKTTLANCLLDDPIIQTLHLQSINVDARKIIRSMGRRGMDEMTSQELQTFQKEYIMTKMELEKDQENYITQRSFVDAAAFWSVRDAANLDSSENEEIIQLCRSNARKYDAHIFLPFGQIPIEYDGYRSKDLQQYENVSNTIELFLKEWGIDYLRISSGDLNKRICEAKKYILQHC